MAATSFDVNGQKNTYRAPLWAFESHLPKIPRLCRICRRASCITADPFDRHGSVVVLWRASRPTGSFLSVLKNAQNPLRKPAAMLFFGRRAHRRNSGIAFIERLSGGFIVHLGRRSSTIPHPSRRLRSGDKVRVLLRFQLPALSWSPAASVDQYSVRPSIICGPQDRAK